MEFRKRRILTNLCYWHLNDSIAPTGMINQVSPIRIDNDAFAPCYHEQKVLGSCQGNIHTPDVAQESDSMTTSGADARENNNVGLTTLKCVDSIDFDELSVSRS
jgi:hypothetical protein